VIKSPIFSHIDAHSQVSVLN